MRIQTNAGLRLMFVVTILLSSDGAGMARAAGPTTSAVLTLVDANGQLVAVPESGPAVRVGMDIGSGERVTSLAWHPSAPEVLIVRRQQDPQEGPVDRLTSLDLTTGAEQELMALHTAQPRIQDPYYGTDGRWAYATLGCCLGRDLVVFEEGTTLQASAWQILEPTKPPPPEGDLQLWIGPVTRADQVLVAAEWYFPGRDLPDLDGLYLLSRDLATFKRLTRGEPIRPIGMGPDETWVAGLRETSLRVVDLPTGTERTLLAPDELPLADAKIGPDGTIAVATGPPYDLALDYVTFDDIWLVNPSDGTRRNLTKGAFRQFTAFAWAPVEVLRQLPEIRNLGTLPGPSQAPVQLPMP